MVSDPIQALFKARDAVYGYFDFTPDWVVYPFKDLCGHTWHIEQFGNGYSELMFCRDGQEQDIDNWYHDEVCTQRFYDKWVYRGEDYTMVFDDSGCDMMKYFSIFENSRESVELPEVYQE